MCAGHVKAEKQNVKKYTKKSHDMPKYTMHPVASSRRSRVQSRRGPLGSIAAKYTSVFSNRHRSAVRLAVHAPSCEVGGASLAPLP